MHCSLMWWLPFIGFDFYAFAGNYLLKTFCFGSSACPWSHTEVFEHDTLQTDMGTSPDLQLRWELHQIYNLDAAEGLAQMNWWYFEVKRSKVKITATSMVEKVFWKFRRSCFLTSWVTDNLSAGQCFATMDHLVVTLLMCVCNWQCMSVCWSCNERSDIHVYMTK